MLGELATVAPVLYTNVNFPNLKEEYPGLQREFKVIGQMHVWKSIKYYVTINMNFPLAAHLTIFKM